MQLASSSCAKALGTFNASVGEAFVQRAAHAAVPEPAMKPFMFLSSAAFALSTSLVALAGDEQAKPDAPAAPSYVSAALNAGVPPSAVVPASAPAACIDTDPRYKPVPPNQPLLIVGGLVLLSSYATTALAAANSNAKSAEVAYLPLIGPWAYLASPIGSTSLTTVDTMLLIGGGVAQGIGAMLMVTSLFIPGPARLSTVRAGAATIHFGPTSFGMASAGAAAVGSF